MEKRQENILGHQKKREMLHFMLRSLLICILLFFIILALLMNTAGLMGVLKQSAKEYASQVTIRLAGDISHRLQTYQSYVIQVADTFGRMPDHILTEELLSRKKEAMDLDGLMVLNEDGTVFPQDYSFDGMEEWEKEHPGFRKEPQVSDLDGTAILFSAPIYAQGESQGVLVGLLGMENVRKLLGEVDFNKKGLSCIVDRDGNIIATPSQSPVLDQLKSMTGEKAEESNRETVAREIREVIENTDGEGEFELLLDSGLMVTSWALDVGDWMILVFVPDKLGSEESSVYLQRYLLIVGASALVFLGILFYLSINEKNNLKKIEKAAFSDPLTGGINGFAFKLQCAGILQENPQAAYGIVFFNLRNFKEINRQFGVESGNQTLRYFYKILLLHLKENERLTRSEMDHFFLFVNEETEEAIQSRIDQMLEDVNAFEGKNPYSFPLRLSQGACLVGNARENIQNYMDRAKIASGDHKEGQPCKFYDEELNERLLRQKRLDETFQYSIEHECFEVYFQPKVSIEEGKPGGAEALVRWNHPEYGWLSPQEFIPMFEENGKICELDFYVFRQVCRQLANWHEELGCWLPVSVNLSRTHLRELRLEFVEYFKQVKQEYQIPDWMLEIELTESMAFGAEQMEMVALVIKRIRACGFCCSLDDFGFGYSSLAMMNQLEVDAIKLDRQFFIKENEKTWIIVSSFIHLAHELGMKVVAEGIEDKDQLDKLRNSDCDMVQGYIYSRPLPGEEFIQWYKNVKE